MKLKIVFDVEPWMQASHVWFYNADQTILGAKFQSAKRYLVEVEIPDPIGADIIIQAEAKEETK